MIVERDLAEPLSDALMEAGALSVDVSDADAGTATERPIFDEPGGAPAPGWARARVSALFTIEAEVPRALAQAFDAAGVPPSSAYEIGRVEDDDWVRRTQAQFTPQEVAPGLWIVPSWHALPDPGATNVVLDPGLAFGTGTHPTTRLVLDFLERTVLGGERVLDYGCGSGILAIAAAKLGAAQVDGVDVDPQALETACANAGRNGIALRATLPEALPAGSYDIVVSNILAQPLIVLAPLLAARTRPGGRIALAGILQAQAAELAAAYAPWFDTGTYGVQDDWALLAGVRR